MTSFWRALTALLMSVNVVSAEELPKELLLQCEGKGYSITMLGNKPDYKERPFKITLRLRDGSIGDIQYNFLDAKDCRLVDGVIQCELKSVTYIREFDSTEKRHGRVSINRATGEYQYFLETWSYRGKSASGEYKPGVKFWRTGSCRTGKPLF